MEMRNVRRGTVVLGLAGVLAAGCSSMKIAKRREGYIAKNPALPVEVKGAVLNGEIVEGMEQSAVRASWGDPKASVSEKGQSGLTIDRWMYLRKIGQFKVPYEIIFVGGKVQDVRSYGYRTDPVGGPTMFGVEMQQ